MTEEQRLCCKACMVRKSVSYRCENNPVIDEDTKAVLCVATCNPACHFHQGDRCTAEWSYMDKDSDHELVTQYLLVTEEDGTIWNWTAEDVQSWVEADAEAATPDTFDQEYIDDVKADLAELTEWLKTAKLGDSKGFRLYSIGVHQVPRGLVERLPEFEG